MIKTNIKKGRIATVSDIKKAVSHSKIVILTTPAKITTRNKLNFSKIERNCKKIGEVLNRKMLFIYGTIAKIGFIENNIREILENTSGLKAAKDFSVAHETTTEVTATGLKMYGFDVVKNQAGKAANFVERKFRGKKPAPSNQTRSNNNKKKKELTDKEKQKLREFLIAMEKAKAEAQKAQENKED